MLEKVEVDLDNLELFITRKKLPGFLSARGLNVVSYERELILSNLDSFGPTYGFNTLPGHRDNVSFTDDEVNDFNRSVLESHCIGMSPWFSKRELDYIIFAKIHSLSLGGSGISPLLYKEICSAWENDKFHSAKIPKNDSYSSGDVIPGAHLASFLNKELSVDFSIGDMMAVINGDYFHVGSSLSIRKELMNTSFYLVDTVIESIEVIEMGKKWNERFIDVLLSVYPKRRFEIEKICLPENTRTRQASVSFRSIPDLIESFKVALDNFDAALIKSVSRKSANPLFIANSVSMVSQASFISPTLSFATSQLIDVYQFLSWQSLNRIKYMLNPLSGNYQDASVGKMDLGLIQVPKKLQARLDDMRMKTSTRPFSFGSDASQGVEDTWTYGVLLNIQLKNMNFVLNEILVEEAAVAQYIKYIKNNKKIAYIELVKKIKRERGLKCFS